MKHTVKSQFIMLLILLFFAIPISADDKAPLGSPDFYPSPEHPVGWRCDGSGRFPGATPPTTWSRRLKDITSEIVVQAVKPEGEPGADSHTLAYFTVKDWLIAGPFTAPDPEKDIDNDFLGGEDKVQPDAGDKAGTSQWKVYRAYEGSQSYRDCNEYTCSHLWLDLVYAFGKLTTEEKPVWKGRNKYVQYTNLDKKAAYAHTYLYAPREADVYMDMVHELPAVKMWVNGTPQRIQKSKGRRPSTVKIHLKKGWNRLMIKTICDKAQKAWRYGPKDVRGQVVWRFAIYIKPSEPGPFPYETKNITWMTKLTGRNCSQPITVGDKLFVGSGDTDLFCLDKKTGKILWMHTVTYKDAMTDEEYAAVKEKAAPLLEELDKTNKEMVLLLNKNISSQGLDTGLFDTVDKQIDKRNNLARSVHRALSQGSKGKLYDNEVSAGNATPCSDGRFVYWVVQGKGGYLSTAFDLDGKRIWSSYEYQEGAGEHGSHRSPLLCEGRLLVTTNEKLIAYDAATGKELWRTPGTPHQHGIDGTPIVVNIDGKKALRTPKNLVSLDGEILSEKSYRTWGCYVPIVEDGVLYNCSSRNNWTFEAIRIPIDPRALREQKGGNWKLGGRTLYGPLADTTGFFYTASPLYVDGIVYQVDMSGIMVAIDTRDRKRAYLHWMDGYNFNSRSLYGYCASPTLAGKNIYFMDEVGYTTIIKPGPDCTVIGNNILQNLSNIRGSAPGKQEAFYAGMYFDGKRMFVHSDNYMYCIEENGRIMSSAGSSNEGKSVINITQKRQASPDIDWKGYSSEKIINVKNIAANEDGTITFNKADSKIIIPRPIPENGRISLDILLPELPNTTATIMSNTLESGSPTWYLEVLKEGELRLSVFYGAWARFTNPAKIEPGTWHKLEFGWGELGIFLSVDDKRIEDFRKTVPKSDSKGSFGLGLIYRKGPGAPKGMQVRVPGLTLPGSQKGDANSSEGSKISSAVSNSKKAAGSSPTCGFRGNGSGMYQDSKIPLKWSAETEPRWKAEVGDGFGCPAVSGNYVFVTSEPDKLVCVDLTSGKILWSRSNGFDQLPADEAGSSKKQSTDCGYATPTPVTDGSHVWAVYGTGIVACYDMKGERTWIRFIDIEQTNEYGRSASPVMADGKLIVTITHLMALDPKTGETIWEQEKAREAYGTPAVTRIGTTEVLVTPTGYLVAARDGKVIVNGMGTAANTSPVVHDGVAYFCDSETAAWKLPETLKDKPEELWVAEVPGDVFASPVFCDNILYCLGNDGYFYAFNTADGEAHYEEELVAGDMPMDMTDFYPSLILANGHILVTNNGGQTAVIKPGSEFEILRVNKLSAGSGSTPAISGNTLIIRSGSNLLSF